MSETQAILRVWEFNYLDVPKAFRGVKEEHLHIRPAPNTIAISEIAAHIADCEANAILRILLKKPKRQWGIQSVFFDTHNWYPPAILAQPTRPELLAMNVSQVVKELHRVHTFVREAVKDYDMPADMKLGKAWGGEPTIRSHLSYVGYHVAYHVEQIYLTRHLLGERTPGQA